MNRTTIALEQLEDRITPAGFMVTHTDDGLTGSLRAAIAAADSDTSGMPFTITFDPTVFASAQTIILGSTLDISNTAGDGITIEGPAAALTIQGGGVNSNFSVFTVETNTAATIDNLAIANGHVLGDGGGVLNAGTLTLSNCMLSGNSVYTLDGVGLDGGGIYNTGTLTVSNCTLSDNIALGAGSAIFNGGMLTVNNSTFLNNPRDHAIDNACTMTVSDSTLTASSLYNEGSVFLTGNLNLYQGTEFNNEGELTLADTSFISRGDGDTSNVLFFNEGIVSKPSGPGESGLLLPITAGSNIDVSAGGLEMGDNISESMLGGYVNLDAGTTLYLTGTGSFQWSSATFTGPGTTTIEGTATVTLRRAGPAGGGYMETVVQGETVVNYGTMVLAASDPGGLQLSGGASVQNYGSVLDENPHDACDISAAGSGGTFINETTGTITQAAAGTLIFQVPFENDGTSAQAVAAQAGELQIRDGFGNGNFRVESNAVLGCTGTFGGNFYVAAHAELYFNSDEHLTSTLEPSSNVTSDGEVFFWAGNVAEQGSLDVSPSGYTAVIGQDDFTGKVVSVGSSLSITGYADFHDTAVTVPELSLNGGLFISEADVTVTSTLNWSFASGIMGPGTARVGPAATMTIEGDGVGPLNSYLVGGRQLVNEGTASFQGSGAGNGDILMGGGASVINNGTFYLDSKFFLDGGSAALTAVEGFNVPSARIADFPTTGALSFVNNGTLVKTSVGNGGGCTAGVAFDNDGTVQVQSGGSLDLLGGGTSTGTFMAPYPGPSSYPNPSLGFVGDTTFYPSVAIEADSLEIAQGSLTLRFINTGSGVQFASISASSIVLGGQLNITEPALLQTTPGEMFTILNNTGTGGPLGTFNIAEGGLINLGDGTQFQITYQGGPNDNSVVLTVLHAAVLTPSVMVSGGPFIYSGGPQGATAIATGVGGAPVSGSFIFTYNGSSTVPTNAGTYAVVATFTSSDPAYTSATGNGTLVINQAPSPVLVNSDLMLVGTNPPALTGIVNGTPFTGSTTFTTAQGDTLTVTLSSSVSSSSPVGTYAITASISGSGAGNYLPPAAGAMYVVSVGQDTGTGAKNFAFWDNKGHAALISAADLVSLRQLNLVNLAGSGFDPTTAAQLQSWLQTGNAKNAAYWLAVQLATMDLDVLSSYVQTTDVVYAGNLLVYVGTSYSTVGLDGGGFITIANLMTLANNALALYPVATGGSTFRSYLLDLAQALQAADNNTSFVQQLVPPGS